MNVSWSKSIGLSGSWSFTTTRAGTVQSSERRLPYTTISERRPGVPSARRTAAGTQLTSHPSGSAGGVDEGAGWLGSDG